MDQEGLVDPVGALDLAGLVGVLGLLGPVDLVGVLDLAGVHLDLGAFLVDLLMVYAASYLHAFPAYAVAGCYKIASVVHHEAQAQALSSTRIVIYSCFLSLLSALNCYYYLSWISKVEVSLHAA